MEQGLYHSVSYLDGILSSRAGHSLLAKTTLQYVVGTCS